LPCSLLALQEALRSSLRSFVKLAHALTFLSLAKPLESFRKL